MAEPDGAVIVGPPPDEETPAFIPATLTDLVPAASEPVAWPAIEARAEGAPAETPPLTTRTQSEVGTRVGESLAALANPLQEPPDALAGWGPTPVTEGLADLTRIKIRRDSAIMNQMEGRLEEDRARIKKAYDATGVQPGELLPWDYDKQREKFATNPLESFGSIGSIFAILASSFTRDPMTNALNGAAAAMNAVKEGNEREYARAYDAWQKNNDLAVKRHNIQQHAYDNAIRLMDTDFKLGQAKLQMEATRFGDQKTLWLLENGMDKEVIELQRQRAEAIKSQVEASAMLTQDGFRRETLKVMMKDYDAQAANITGQSPAEIAGRKLALFNHVFGKATPVPQEAFGLLLMGMPEAPIADVIKKAQDMGIMPHRLGSNAMNIPAEIARRAKTYEEDPNSPTFGDHAASYDRAAKEVKASTAAPGSQTSANAEIMRRTKLYEEDQGSPTYGDHIASYNRAAAEVKAANQPPARPSMQAENVESLKAALADIKAEHPDWTESQQREEANRRVAQSKVAIPGKTEVDLKQRINKFTHAAEVTDKILGTLERHKDAAGIAGKVMRFEERMANIFGSSKSTDYVQMMRDVELLRGWAKELMFSKNERLKAEGQRINDIIGGTSAGDTHANTVRSLKDAKKLWLQMKSEDEQILNRGTSGGPRAPAAPATESPSGKKWWEEAPLKKSETSNFTLAADIQPVTEPDEDFMTKDAYYEFRRQNDKIPEDWLGIRYLRDGVAIKKKLDHLSPRQLRDRGFKTGPVG